MKRRDFLRLTVAAAGASGLLAACGCGRRAQPTGGPAPAPVGQAPQPAPSPSAALAGKVGKNRHVPHPVEGLDVVVAKGTDPAAALRAGLNPFGGLEAFVQRGDRVVIKPNLAWARLPEQAATTSPGVLEAVVKACLQAGAGEVLVIEHCCDSARAAFDLSGAQAVCQSLRVPLLSLDDEGMYEPVALAKGLNLREEQVARDLLQADVYINLPACKVHSATLVTLALKNQMGAVWNRQRYHQAASEEQQDDNLHQNIADLSTALRPTLVVIDATRLLLTNGPKGPGRTELAHTLVISPDAVAADAVACGLLKVAPEKVGHVRLAEQAGVGRARGLQVKRVTV
jgi:uncharacterized protein (DUF362 family)